MGNSAKDVFLDALELPEPERSAFVARACGDDDELLASVRALLDVHHDADSLLESLAFRVPTDLGGPSQEDTSFLARRIGAHQLVDELGRGGMGIVYRAERVDGEFEHEVAIKILRPGLVADHSHRFQAERRILAALRHPSIAQLLDGGTLEDGTPYLVMEYVPGEPLTEYCRERALAPRARLDLFLDVCGVVQFAHQNLIVHRDLKPSNILVVDEDGEPRIKLLDFGIAKLLADHHHSTELTAGERLLTPSYASPEQVRGETVTTASDVFQLGVLLHEALTGELPPSRDRRISDRELRAASRLPKDLELICAKAMRDQPERRYPSAAELAADIRRHLSGYPVHARPESRAYRIRKFVARNRWSVTAGGIVGLLLMGFTVVTTIQKWEIARQRDRVTTALQEAERERDEARQVSEFLVQIFENNDPWRMKGDPLDLPQLLDSGISRIADLDSQPVLQADLQHTMGKVCANLGRNEQAEKLFRAALETRRSLPDTSPHDVAASLDALANTLYARNQLAASADAFRELLEIQLSLHERRSRPVAKTLYRLGALIHGQGSFREGEDLFRESVEIYASLPGRRDLDEVHSLQLLGQLLSIRRQWDEAVPLLDKSLAILEEIYGADHLEFARGLGLVAACVERQDLMRAETLLRRALAIESKRDLDPDHPVAARHAVALGRILSRTKRPAEGEPLLRQGWRAHLGHHGPRHDHTLTAQLYLGECLVLQERYEEARRLLTGARDVWRETRGPRHPQIGHALVALGNACKSDGLRAEAETHFREALELWKSWRPDHPEVAIVESHLRDLQRE